MNQLESCLQFQLYTTCPPEICTRVNPPEDPPQSENGEEDNGDDNGEAVNHLEGEG